MKRRTKIAAVSFTVALLITAGTAGAALASGGTVHPPQREGAALTGTAQLYRSAGDDITFTFDAHLADAADPLKATGTFEWSHYGAGDGAWSRAKVDCLVTGGKVAVVSGVITASSPNHPEFVGHRVGITVHDTGGVDRLGYSWAAVEHGMGPKDLPRCLSSAPFEKVKQGTGDFKVVPWQPKP
ncbi:Repetin [Streptomyces sp. NPDC006314]|uniref:Repetin n=1 Tax=Streptomyces sp. NPDC006314 TaxID=3154475 RepID=UPI0033B5FB72